MCVLIIGFFFDVFVDSSFHTGYGLSLRIHMIGIPGRFSWGDRFLSGFRYSWHVNSFVFL